jgi:16S rRNA (guanine527-N7)-methyltransferase
MDNFKQDIQTFLGIQLSALQSNQFTTYEQELVSWNERFNLTAIRDLEGIHNKHFIDSLSCTMAFTDSPPARLIDIGTGAGFPGIPLKILFPSMSLTLVDSVGKKVEFCRHVVETLKLERVEVLQARAEELGQSPKHREKYDWAVARAVANLPTLIEFLLPLTRVGGGVLAQKGESGLAEAHASEKVVQILGGRLRQLRKVNIPGVVEDRYLIIIDKVAPTPSQYPRRVGVPSKKPLI